MKQILFFIAILFAGISVNAQNVVNNTLCDIVVVEYCYDPTNPCPCCQWYNQNTGAVFVAAQSTAPLPTGTCPYGLSGGIYQVCWASTFCLDPACGFVYPSGIQTQACPSQSFCPTCPCVSVQNSPGGCAPQSASLPACSDCAAGSPTVSFAPNGDLEIN